MLLYLVESGWCLTSVALKLKFLNYSQQSSCSISIGWNFEFSESHLLHAHLSLFMTLEAWCDVLSAYVLVNSVDSFSI